MGDGSYYEASQSEFKLDGSHWVFVHSGFWCLHCEKCCTWNTVKKLSDASLECPHCEAPEYDLWAIQGDYKHGEYVEHGSDRLISLLSEESDELD